MALQTKDSLKTKIDANIVTNATRSITASKINEILNDIADSVDFIGSGDVVSKASAFTIALTDVGKLIDVNSATSVNATIPNDSDINFSIGAKIDLFQYNSGQVVITASPGVTIRSNGNKFKTAGLNSVITIRKRGTNDWVVYGDTAA